jgi:hypothetical protein
VRRFDDRLPSGAAAQVGSERRLDLVSAVCGASTRSLATLERSEAHEYPGRAEPALAGPGADEGVGPAITLVGG